MIEVSFCSKNAEGKTIRNRLAEEHPEVTVTTKDCLGVCEKCAEQPFARVNGKSVYAKNAKELYSKIEESLG